MELAARGQNLLAADQVVDEFVDIQGLTESEWGGGLRTGSRCKACAEAMVSALQRHTPCPTSPPLVHGGLDWPSSSFPQHLMMPPLVTPQVCNPALTPWLLPRTQLVDGVIPPAPTLPVLLGTVVCISAPASSSCRSADSTGPFRHPPST